MSDSQLKGENRIIIEIEKKVVKNGSGFKLHKHLNKNIFQGNEEIVKQNVKQVNENDQVQKSVPSYGNLVCIDNQVKNDE